MTENLIETVDLHKSFTIKGKETWWGCVDAGENDRRIRFRTFFDIHHVGQDLPFDLQSPQGFIAEILRLADHDAAHLGSFHIRDIVKPWPWRAPVFPVTDKIGDIRVLPGEDIHHPGDRPGFGGIQLCDLRIGVGAVEEAGIEHIRFHIVRTELGDACRHGIGKHTGQIGLAYDLKFLPQSVYACIIRHSADLLIPIPVCSFERPA